MNAFLFINCDRFIYTLIIIIIIMSQRYLRQDLERTLIEHGVKDIGEWMNQAVKEKIQRAFGGGDSKVEQ